MYELANSTVGVSVNPPQASSSWIGMPVCESYRSTSGTASPIATGHGATILFLLVVCVCVRAGVRVHVQVLVWCVRVCCLHVCACACAGYLR